MSINFTCPNCHQEIEADDSFQGMEANCPSCDTKLIVPVPNSSQIPRDDERECPFCGEIIKKKAIICRFCKEKLDGSSIVNNGYQPEEAQSASKEDTDGGNGKTEDILTFILKILLKTKSKATVAPQPLKIKKATLLRTGSVVYFS